MSSDVELNEIGVLKRREIEARLLAPIVDALGDRFGRHEVLEVVRSVITGIARGHSPRFQRDSRRWVRQRSLRESCFNRLWLVSSVAAQRSHRFYLGGPAGGEI